VRGFNLAGDHGKPKGLHYVSDSTPKEKRYTVHDGLLTPDF
jgi:hypothetical protein